MLEYFTYKKVKKHKAEKDAKKATESAKDEAVANTTATDLKNEASDISRASSIRQKPILKHEDERFIEDLLSTTDDEPAPPLPSRDHLAVPAWHADWSSSDEELDKNDKGKGKQKETAVAATKKDEKAEKKGNRLSLLFSRNKKPADELKPDEEVVTPKEAEREKNDLGRVLDRLNLSAKNNKVVSLGSDTSELLQKFTQVFKDLANGVPTAYDDLTKLIEDRDGTIAKGFDKLPSSLQKLVTQLPDKVTGSLGPEILATAAKSQGIKSAGGEGFKDTAKNILMPHNIAELVTKPGAIAGMLRAIVEALKARWPAFLGMNVIWSVALTLLLFMLWYCHKRGREVRLEREQSENAIDGSSRIEELPDDLALPAPGTVTATREIGESSGGTAATTAEPVAAEPPSPNNISRPLFTTT